jgi:outer membrane murein-binding lipoprotein Lpp
MESAVKKTMVNFIVGMMVLPSVGTIVAGCGELKKVDEMHDSTAEMNKTTGKMNETTSEMNSKMKSMEAKTTTLSQMTDELYDTLRQGNSLQLRREAYDAVLKAPTFFKKTSEAGKYFMSFEFQVMNNLGQDLEPGKRDVLAQQEAQEFFMEIEELAPRDGSINPTASPNSDKITSQENRTASFNAMAVTSHQMNRKEVRTGKLSREFAARSLYSMIEEALLAPRDKAQSGYIREIMAHQEKAIQIVQTRLNMFPMMFIDLVSKISERSFFEKAEMMVLGWECDLDSLNATQIEFYQTEVLDQAIQAKQLLVKLGLQPKMDSTLLRLLQKMKIKANVQKNSVASAGQVRLIGLLEELKK